MELRNYQDDYQVTVRCRDLHLHRDIYLVTAASLNIPGMGENVWV